MNFPYYCNTIYLIIKMDHDIAMHTYHDVTLHIDVARTLPHLLCTFIIMPNFDIAVFLRNSLKLHIKQYQNKVLQHKNNQFIVYRCLEIRFIAFVYGYFIHPSDSWHIPTQKTIHLYLQTRVHPQGGYSHPWTW